MSDHPNRIDQLRAQFPASRILRLLAVLSALSAVLQLIGYNNGGTPFDWSDQIRVSIRYIFGSLVFYTASMITNRAENSTKMLNSRCDRMSIIFIMLALSSAAGIWRDLSGQIVSSDTQFVLILAILMTSIVASIGLYRKRASGWYFGWLTLILFSAYIIISFFSIETNMILKDIGLPLVLVGNSIIGLHLNATVLRSEIEQSLPIGIQWITILLGFSSFVLLAGSPIGILTALFLIIFVFVARKRIGLQEMWQRKSSE